MDLRSGFKRSYLAIIEIFRKKHPLRLRTRHFPFCLPFTMESSGIKQQVEINLEHSIRTAQYKTWYCSAVIELLRSMYSSFDRPSWILGCICCDIKEKRNWRELFQA